MRAFFPAEDGRPRSYLSSASNLFGSDLVNFSDLFRA